MLNLKWFDIPGLYYIKNIFENYQHFEDKIMQDLDFENFETCSKINKREVLQYGWKYDFKNKKIGENIKDIPNKFYFIPQIIHRLAENVIYEQLNTSRSQRLSYLNQLLITKGEYDQIVINKYKKGERVTSHIDHKDFGEIIIIFSIGQPTNIIYKELNSNYEKKIKIEPNSVVFMLGPARWKYTHETEPLEIDNKYELQERYSFTYRQVSPNIGRNIDMKNIIEFYKGNSTLEYGFLSNFYAFSPIEFQNDKVDNINYDVKTSEHLFQVMKFINPEYRNIVLNAKTPSQSKKLGQNREKTLVKNYDLIRVNNMYYTNYLKFVQNDKNNKKGINILKNLLSTENKLLIEHTKYDSFWGDGTFKEGDKKGEYKEVSTYSGNNNLGRVLMFLRDYFQNYADFIEGDINQYRIFELQDLQYLTRFVENRIIYLINLNKKIYIKSSYGFLE